MSNDNDFVKAAIAVQYIVDCAIADEIKLWRDQVDRLHPLCAATKYLAKFKAQEQRIRAMATDAGLEAANTDRTTLVAAVYGAVEDACLKISRTV